MKKLPSRAIAWFAGVILLAGLAAPVLGAHAIVDFDCGDVALSSEPGGTPALETARPPVDHEHCLLCHFQRVLRSAWSEGLPTDTVFRIVNVEAVTPARRLRDRSRFQIPSRAPPFLLS